MGRHYFFLLAYRTGDEVVVAAPSLEKLHAQIRYRRA